MPDTALTTFAVSPVTPAAEPLPEVAYTEAVRSTLSGGWDREFFQQQKTLPPVALESCSQDTKALIERVDFHPFVAAVHKAFAGHRPLTLSPDMLWLTVAQGFALHVRTHAEEMRGRFVAHTGKKTLEVRRDGFVRGFAGNDWEGVFAEFSAQIRQNIGDALHELFMPQFSTTGVVERAATEVALMDVVAPYFEYSVSTLCGIPSIMLEGTPEDWAALEERARRLAGFGCDWWLAHLLPVLGQFARASRGDVDTDFWQSLYKVDSGSGGPYIDGHLLALFPYVYLGTETPQSNHLLKTAREFRQRGLTMDNLPSGLSDVPFVWNYHGKMLPMRFVAGFVGVAQDAETLAVRPEIGWAVCDPSVQPQSRPAPAFAGPERIIRPDTPPNRRLVKAVEKGDLAAVQSTLREGASADTQTGWDGQPEFISVAFLAAQLTSQAQSTVRMKALKPWAKKGQCLPIFRLLIQHVADPNADSGCSLLSAAVDLDDLDSVKCLVEKGADVNAPQTRFQVGATALSLAVMQGKAKAQQLSPITAYLLDHGAAVNVTDEQGATPLMQAAGRNKTGAVQAMLARGADPALRDKRGWTALRWAAGAGWGDVVAILEGCSPMDVHEAAQFGDVARVRAHMDAGADPNAPNAQGMPPLSAAAKSDSLETAALLLDRGADVNGRERSGITALHLAALYGDMALASLLLDRGADINTVALRQSGGSVTPLLYAVQQAQADVVALLIQRGVDVRQEQGTQALETALRIAQHPRAPHGGDRLAVRDRVINLLLGAGVDVRASHALYLAAKDGQPELVELFLRKGADVNKRGPSGSEGTQDDGQTALMGAVTFWLEEAGGRGSAGRGRQCVETLLAHGAQVDTADPKGRTALMRAAAENDRALAGLLLKRHADVNHADKRGRTALMLAIDDDSQDGFQDADFQDAVRAARAELTRSSSLPSGSDLSSAARSDSPNPSEHTRMVRLLLQHGASVHAEAAKGTTALRLALEQGFGDVAVLLMQAGADR